MTALLLLSHPNFADNSPTEEENSNVRCETPEILVFSVTCYIENVCPVTVVIVIYYLRSGNTKKAIGFRVLICFSLFWEYGQDGKPSFAILSFDTSIRRIHKMLAEM
jgi:hypothetical protein